MGIQFTRPSRKEDADKMSASSDASYADLEGSRSTLGYIVKLNNGPLAWTTKVTSGVAKSTCESEYEAMSACVSEVIYLQQLLGELGVRQDTTVLRIDNTAAEAISKDDKHHQRTRAIRLRHHHVRGALCLRARYGGEQRGPCLRALACICR